MEKLLDIKKTINCKPEADGVIASPYAYEEQKQMQIMSHEARKTTSNERSHTRIPVKGVKMLIYQLKTNH